VFGYKYFGESHEVHVFIFVSQVLQLDEHYIHLFNESSYKYLSGQLSTQSYSKRYFVSIQLRQLDVSIYLCIYMCLCMIFLNT
jgi:hypothetical protein